MCCGDNVSTQVIFNRGFMLGKWKGRTPTGHGHELGRGHEPGSHANRIDCCVCSVYYTLLL